MFAELSFSGHMSKKLLSVVARGSLRWFQLQTPKTKPRIIAGANKCQTKWPNSAEHVLTTH